MDGMDGKSELRKDMEDALKSGAGPGAAQFALAAVSGALGSAADAWSKEEAERLRKIMEAWLKLQEEEIKEIGKTLHEVMERVDQSDEKIKNRVESPNTKWPFIFTGLILIPVLPWGI